MLERKRERWLNTFSYFFGTLTEEEQMYRDYFETDLEENPDDEADHERTDMLALGQDPDMNFDNYDFQEMIDESDPHETIEDVVDNAIFKYKY